MLYRCLFGPLLAFGKGFGCAYSISIRSLVSTMVHGESILLSALVALVNSIEERFLSTQQAGDLEDHGTVAELGLQGHVDP